MKPSGNVILITGGGTGIGLSLAEKFLNEGNEVIICGRTKATLDDAQRKFPKLKTIVADLVNSEGRANLITEISDRFPKLNVLINNAGVYSITDILDSNYIATLEKELTINLVAPISLIQQLFPILEGQKDATIVNVTSGYAFIPSAQSSAYSASKMGLRAITQGLRFHLRNNKAIRIVEVVPPAVDTQMNKGKNISLMTTQIFAEKVFKGLIGDEDEIIIGMSKMAKLLSRLAPKFGFKKMNTDEEKQRNIVAV
ncbi:SDR family NAD(P)-dependent oxidoreductase [Chryseobacterium sp. SIMBA_038]|uniref:SDR family NAD(P)-dependent oxidoreductase n=1 Tax=Chryseobacterium sp. SIMBA_038 TaxID=3085780 RepID=UPI003978D30A